MHIHSLNTASYAASSFRGITTNSPKEPSPDNQDEAKKTQADKTADPKQSDPTNSLSEQEAKKEITVKIGSPSSTANLELNLKEQKIVQELKTRDREVRAHEAAHLGAAGPYATGGPSYTYKRGPDGVQYAVGGEVGIDTSEVPNDPEATIRKAQTIRRAANAPANPSTQDRRVASKAAGIEASARQELTQEKIEKSGEGTQSIRTEESGKIEGESKESDSSSETNAAFGSKQGNNTTYPSNQNSIAFQNQSKNIGSLFDLTI